MNGTQARLNGNGPLYQKLVVRFAEEEREVEVARENEHYRAKIGGREIEIEWDELECGRVVTQVDRHPQEFRLTRLSDGALRVEWRGRQTVVRVEDDLSRRARLAHGHQGGPLSVRSPMPGTVIKILVESGEVVTTEQPLCIVEAMKMQNEIDAPIAGTIARIAVTAGDAVDGDQVLIEIEP